MRVLLRLKFHSVRYDSWNRSTSEHVECTSISQRPEQGGRLRPLLIFGRGFLWSILAILLPMFSSMCTAKCAAKRRTVRLGYLSAAGGVRSLEVPLQSTLPGHNDVTLTQPPPALECRPVSKQYISSVCTNGGAFRQELFAKLVTHRGLRRRFVRSFEASNSLPDRD